MNPILPRTLPRTIAIALSVGLLAACAGTPQRPPELVRLQAQLDQLHADPAVVQFAPTELRDADNAVAFLLAEGDRMRAPLFDHNIYLAQRLVGIAEATGHGTAAEARIASLSGERERLVLQARASETAAARAAAAQARADADAARYAAGRAMDDAEQARRMAMADVEAARMAAEQARLEAARAQSEAERERLAAAAARQELEHMQAMITDLEAKQTDRGLVVTLGDVLFEVDRAELKPGAMRNLQQLADALQRYPETEIAIEGHTDSTGSHEYNQGLSERRAATVRNFLAGQGVGVDRLATLGLGETQPVAPNSTSAGRQQNRRVEVVIQNDAGSVVQIDQ